MSASRCRRRLFLSPVSKFAYQNRFSMLFQSSFRRSYPDRIQSLFRRCRYRPMILKRKYFRFCSRFYFKERKKRNASQKVTRRVFCIYDLLFDLGLFYMKHRPKYRSQYTGCFKYNDLHKLYPSLTFSNALKNISFHEKPRYPEAYCKDRTRSA